MSLYVMARRSTRLALLKKQEEVQNALELENARLKVLVERSNTLEVLHFAQVEILENEIETLKKSNHRLLEDYMNARHLLEMKCKSITTVKEELEITKRQMKYWKYLNEKKQ